MIIRNKYPGANRSGALLFTNILLIALALCFPVIASASPNSQPALENKLSNSAASSPLTALTITGITITILSGNNLDGEKAYRVEYKTKKAVSGMDSIPKEIPVTVTYKSAEDENKYAVTEVNVEEDKLNTFLITTKIDLLKPGEEAPQPRVFFVEYIV